MRNHNKHYTFLVYIALVIATFIAYEPVRHNDFVALDDPDYVTENPNVKKGITRESILWAFTAPHSGNWHPLTSLSHMLDCQLFGLNPLWHHLMNLLFHVANTLLLFSILKKTNGAVWPSAFVAAAFALHPLHVESVAWASERKDVLSGFFWMLTMIAYLRYAEKPGTKRYLMVILAFSLGLMAKPMLVTLPFVLLLLDYWPLGRLQLSQTKKEKTSSISKPEKANYQSASMWYLIMEKIPLFALAAVSSIITFFLQQSAGAMALMEKLPLNFRISNALVSYISYISKMIYPNHLTAYYPILKIPSWQPIVFFLILLATTALVNISRRRYLTVGWLWYLGTLVPVIGLVQVGSQAMADRYTYLPSIGIFIMVAWGSAEVFEKLRFKKIIPAIISCIVLTAFLICTRIQAGYWQNNLTLYGHAVEVTKDNFRMHCSYGAALLEDRQYDEATRHFRQALQIKPDYVKAHNGLGKALLGQGNFQEAIKSFNEVLRNETNWAEVYANLGLAYAQLGNDNLAVTNWTKSIELDPNSANNLNNLAWLLATAQDTNLRNPTDAVKYAQMAYELAEQNHLTFLDTLAAAYAAAGNFPEAVKTAEKAIKLAEAADEKDLAKEIQERLDLYKLGQPYHGK